jgi:hypothetical protein
MKGIRTEIGALVVIQPFRVLVYDICCYFVQESPVVRNDQNSTGVGLEVIG